MRDAVQRNDEPLIRYLLRCGADPSGILCPRRLKDFLRKQAPTSSRCLCKDRLSLALLSKRCDNLHSSTEAGDEVPGSHGEHLSDVDTITCKFCGGHLREQSAWSYCSVLACKACAHERLPCPQCWDCSSHLQPHEPPDAEEVLEGAPLLVLLDLNGVLDHRLRDGESVPESIQLPPGDHGIPSYMVPRRGYDQLFYRLMELAQVKRCTWGFCSTMKFSNASPIAEQLLQGAGFEFVWCSRNRWRVRYGGHETTVWFFTKDTMLTDTDPGAFSYDNTRHVHELPTLGVVDAVRELSEDQHIADLGRTVIVRGTARKAKLCHSQCLLVHDFDRAAVTENNWQGLERVVRFLDVAPEAGSVAPLLHAANRHFLLKKDGNAATDRLVDFRFFEQPGKARQALRAAARTFAKDMLLQFGDLPADPLA